MFKNYIKNKKSSFMQLREGDDDLPEPDFKYEPEAGVVFNGLDNGMKEIHDGADAIGDATEFTILGKFKS